MSIPALDSTLFELITATVDTSKLDDDERRALGEAIARALGLLASSWLSNELRPRAVLECTPRGVLTEAAAFIDRVPARDDKHAALLSKLRACLGDAISRALRSRGPAAPAESASDLPEGTVSWVMCPACGSDTPATKALCEQCGTAVPLKEETRS